MNSSIVFRVLMLAVVGVAACNHFGADGIGILAALCFLSLDKR